MRKSAFTLAEVLITLGIIGIVAALTIPNLMGAYKKRVVETELKKSYSELAQLIQRSEVDNEAAIYWNWPHNQVGGLQADPDKFFQQYFKPYLKTLDTKNKSSKNYYIYDSTGARITWMDSSVNVSKWYNLYDGRAMMLSVYTTISGDFAEASKGTVGRFLISTTNRKGGDFVVGKNLFSFTMELQNKKLVPTANGWPVWTCTSLEKNRSNFINLCKHYTGNSGVVPTAYCTYLIYCNNWKIPDDYPIKF